VGDRHFKFYDRRDNLGTNWLPQHTTADPAEVSLTRFTNAN